MSHIIKNNASHLSKLLFQEHTHTQCIFKVPWTMKLSSTKTMNLHMNIIVKCSTKWAEKNTFWYKIKCYVICIPFQSCLVMFSQQLGLKTWRFDPLPPSWFCFLAPALNVYDVIWCSGTAHAERSLYDIKAPRELQRTDGSACFRIALAELCTVLLQVEHTYMLPSVGITKC